MYSFPSESIKTAALPLTSSIGSEAVSNKDNSSLKQLKWEADRAKKFEGKDWKSIKNKRKNFKGKNFKKGKKR